MAVTRSTTADGPRTGRTEDLRRNELLGMAAAALSTEPDDKPVHGKLRVCEGHISRIEGVAHQQRGAIERVGAGISRSPAVAATIARPRVWTGARLCSFAGRG
jgi:hypothetical protein